MDRLRRSSCHSLVGCVAAGDGCLLCLHPNALCVPQAWVNTPRAKGGLGGCSYPLVSDLTKQIARDYEVLIEDGADAGVALR
jgi:peroxiredoxin (alkyl hydroperoxide reductase subunit C)